MNHILRYVKGRATDSVNIKSRRISEVLGVTNGSGCVVCSVNVRGDGGYVPNKIDNKRQLIL